MASNRHLCTMGATRRQPRPHPQPTDSVGPIGFLLSHLRDVPENTATATACCCGDLRPHAPLSGLIPSIGFLLSLLYWAVVSAEPRPAACGNGCVATLRLGSVWSPERGCVLLPRHCRCFAQALGSSGRGGRRQPGGAGSPFSPIGFELSLLRCDQGGRTHGRGTRSPDPGHLAIVPRGRPGRDGQDRLNSDACRHRQCAAD